MANEVDFYIKEGDTSPSIQVQLLEDDGNEVDLTSASVMFRMKRVGDDTFTVDGSATIDDAATGKASYSWSDGDTDDIGYYNAEFAVDYDQTGTVDEIFPNTQYITVKISSVL